MAFHPGMHAGMPPQHMGPIPHGTAPPMSHMQNQGIPPGMHAGMAAPNHPHVSQGGPMMNPAHPGMPPNHTAMQHLQGTSQMFPTQNLQQMSHQSMMAQQQQQQHLQRVRAMQEQRQGAPMNMLQGPPQAMTPQHIQNMQQQQQQNMRMNIPTPSLQQSVLAAQMMQQGGMNGPLQRQAGPPGGPAPQSRAPQAIPGMQPTQPAPGGQPGGPGPAPQMRHQPSNQGMQEGQGQQQNQAPQPQQQPQQPQRPPISARQHTNQSSPQVGQQQVATQPQQETPTSTTTNQANTTLAGAQEGPNRVMGQQPPPQPQHQPVAQPAQPQPPPPPQQQPQQAQAQAQSQQQQQSQQQTQSQSQQSQVQGQQNAQQAEKPMVSNPIANQMQRNAQLRQNQLAAMMSIHQSAKFKLLSFSEQLASIHADKKNLPDLGRLQQIVDEFFVASGVFRLSKGPAFNHTADKYYEVPASALARFFYRQFESGAQNILFSMPGAGSQDSQPNTSPQFIQCDHASITYTYSNDQFVRHRGIFKAFLGIQDRFESMDFDVTGHDEFINARKIREKLDSGSPNQIKSPQLKKKQIAAKAKQPKMTVISEQDIPKSPVRPEDGITSEACEFLETVSGVAQMQSLMVFALQNNQLSGQVALQRYSEANQPGQLQALQQMHQMNSLAAAQQVNPQMNMATGVNGFPPGAAVGVRHPGMGNQFASPHANLGLPTGSPHLRPGGSPGQPGLPPNLQGAPMAAPMVAQQSGQGTNSSAPSSNASPNNANRKRRVSQVKPDGSDAGGMPQVNGVMEKNKTAPKLNQQKRQRAN